MKTRIVRETYEQMTARMQRFEEAKKVANDPKATRGARTAGTLVMWETCLAPAPKRVRITETHHCD